MPGRLVGKARELRELVAQAVRGSLLAIANAAAFESLERIISNRADPPNEIIRSGIGLEAAYDDPIEEAICCEHGHRFAALFGRLQVIRLPGAVAFVDRHAPDQRVMLDAPVLDRRRIVLTLAVEAIEDHRCRQGEVGGHPRRRPGDFGQRPEVKVEGRAPVAHTRKCNRVKSDDVPVKISYVLVLMVARALAASTGARDDGSLPGGATLPGVAHRTHTRKENAKKTSFSASPQASTASLRATLTRSSAL
jgi:hypothetical protein